MALESATYINDLVSTNPVTTDPISQAQNHLVMIKTVLKNTFPSFGAPVTATPLQLSYAGTMFSGTSSDYTLTLKANPLYGAHRGGLLHFNPGSADTISFDVLADSNLWTVSSSTSGYLQMDASGTVYAKNSVNAVNGKVQEAGYSLIPTGIIVMFAGTSAPAGWHLCDGTGGTPDLRDRFIVGSGLSYAYATTGGSTGTSWNTSSAGSYTPAGTIDVQGSHSHGAATAGYTLTLTDIPSHTHGINDPGHAHTLSNIVDNLGSSSSAFGGGVASLQIVNKNTGTATTGITVVNAGSGGSHAHSISLDGAHSHNFTGSAVAGHTHTVTVGLPPFFALAFIMKL